MKVISPGREDISPRRRPLNRKKAILAGASAVFIITAVVFLVSNFLHFSGGNPPPGPLEEAVSPDTDVPPAASLLEPESIAIPRGSSLAGLLRSRGFSSREIHRLKESVKPVYNLGKIRAGQELRLFNYPEGGWGALEYEIDDASYLAVQNGAGEIRAEIRHYPVEIRPAIVWGVIESSLIAAVNAAGEKDLLAIELEERCFGWDIDFYIDIRQGDTFKVLVEKKFLDGEFSGYGNILAAEFSNAGKTFRAFRFVYPDTGRADFFDDVGNSKRTEFLKSPLKGGRVTSRFTSSRLHPIYKVYRPHFGVDYGARVGTPVKATADGTVTAAGWNGASGRMVRIRHKNNYETMYLHLSGFGRGIRRGAQVQAGDIIGYVGSSGDSTGPHLDYRILYHGKYINPLSAKFEPADPLREEFSEEFQAEVSKFKMALEAPVVFGDSLPYSSLF